MEDNKDPLGILTKQSESDPLGILSAPDEKKNSSPDSLAGGETTEAEPSVSAPRFISKIKNQNSQALDFKRSDVLKQQMANDLRGNSSPAYKKKYIETLAAKGYDRAALEQFAESVSRPAPQKQATDQMYMDESGELQMATPAVDNTPLILKPGEYASHLLDKLAKNAGEGIEHGTEKMYAGAKQSEEAKRSGKSYDEIAKEQIKGATKYLSGTASAGFSAAGMVVPQLMAFNAAMEVAKEIPAEQKAQVMDALGPGRVLPEDKKAEAFDKTLEVPFTLVSSSAKALGYEPAPETWQADVMELADLAVVLAAGHAKEGAVKIRDKVINTVDAYKDAQKLAIDGQLSDLELKDFQELTEQLQGMTPEKIKAEAETYGYSQPVKHDEDQTKLAELQAKINDPSFNELPKEVQAGLLNDARLAQDAIQLKDGEELMNDALDAQTQGMISDLDEKISVAESSLEGQPPAVKSSIENSINDLKKQRDALQEQSASSVLQHSPEGTGKPGSERAGVEPVIQGDEAAGKEIKDEVQEKKKITSDKDQFIREGIQALKDEGEYDEALHNVYVNQLSKRHEDLTAKKEASVMFAPFYDFTVDNVADAAKVKNSPAYKQYVNNVRVIAHQLGIKIKSIDENIGGFKNAEGKDLIEVSNSAVIEVENFEQAKQLAAFMGSLAPEVQEATIAARFVKDGSAEHNANQYSIPISDIDLTIKALKEAGIADYTINESAKTLNLLDFSKGEDLEFDTKIGTLVSKLKENNVTYGNIKRKPVESEYIASDERHAIIESLRETLRTGDAGREQRGAGLRYASEEALRRNERFRAERGVESQRVEYADLRSKQLKLQEEGKDLSPAELSRMEELHKVLAPVLEETIKSEEQNYLNAKEEIESIATKAVGDQGFNLPFGIKKPGRAAIKILDWYKGKPNSLGDGARTNIIVNDIKHVDRIFDIIKKEYEGGIMREERETTELGYPKRLLEVRTKNGRVAEFQVMEPLAYLAKDGVKDFTPEKQGYAKQLLKDLQDKLGIDIPDGAGHWFYELNRDNKVQPEIRELAKEVSKVYYEAFTDPKKYLEEGKSVMPMIAELVDKVKRADRSAWAKDHLENAPAKVKEGPSTGISEEMEAKQRRELGFEEMEKGIRDDLNEHTFEYLNKEANKLVDSGKVDPVEYARQVIDGDLKTDDLGKTILLRGAVDAGNKAVKARTALREAKANGDLFAIEKAEQEYAQAYADLNDIYAAASEERTRAGRDLNAFKQSMKNDFSLGNLYKLFTKSTGSKKLPPELLAKLEEATLKDQEAGIKIAELEEEIKKQGALIQELRKKQPTEGEVKVKAIREKRKSLFDELKQYRNDKNNPKPDQPYVAKAGISLDNKEIELLSKIVLCYVEEGVVTTMEVAKRLKEDIKGLGIKLSESQLMQILNSEVDGKKVVDSFQNTGMPHLKGTEEFGKLLSEPIPKKKGARETKEEKIRRMAAELDEAHGTKDFSKAGEDYIADREARLLQMKIDREQARQKVKNEAAMLELAKRTKWDKLKENAIDFLNIPRSLMASFDFSAPLRQGLVASVAHPKSALKATAEMFAQFAKQKTFDDWLTAYKLSPEYELAKKSELYVADPSNLKLNTREESFMSNLANRIPLVGHGIRMSERGYVGYLNKLRTDVFKNDSKLLMENGFTFEKDPEVFKALAEFINNTTGRGKMGKKMEDAAGVLNAALFSPRLIASRLNLLNVVPKYGYYARMPKPIRKLAKRDMGRFIGAAVGLLTLAQLGGAEVEEDPRSSDFGKIKINDTRFDVLGGFGQYIHMFAKVGGGTKKTPSGMLDLDEEGLFGEQSRGMELMKFARQKLAPAPAMLADFLFKKTQTGEKAKFDEFWSWDNEYVTHLTPLQLQQAHEAFTYPEFGGWGLFASTMLPSMFGVGVQTYDSEKNVREKRRKKFLKMMKD